MDNSDRITLKEYIERVISEKEIQHDLRFKASEEALILSRNQLLKDLEHLNQLRKEVVEDRGQLIGIEAFDTFKNSLSEWKMTAENRMTTAENRYDNRLRTTTAISIFSCALTIITFAILVVKEFIK